MIWDKFRRQRGDEKTAPPPAAPVPEQLDDVDPSEDDDGGGVPEGAEEVANEPWRERAAAVIPGGSSTGSKRVEALYGDAPLGDTVPTHYSRARGCSLWLVDGESELEVVDCTMALGSVAIGYADGHVLSAVGQAAALGNVAGVPHTLEVSLAERLCDFIPCAEQVRFLKTGAESVSAAVRIARTYTGRDRVVRAGYFGWHDWASGADVAGIPRSARADVVAVPFDDVDALDRAVSDARGALAAIVIEPVVERLPSERWLARARQLATEAGAVLVFDEMKTGFRLKPGGYGELSGVEPDLAVFGKALANGFPLAAVVGRADVMDAARRTWISSTLAGETTALAAAYAVLDWHEREDVCATLATIGAALRSAVDRAIAAAAIPGIRTDGLDQMWRIVFDDADVERLFVRHAVEHGALFKRGAYNFAALAHEDAIGDVESAASAALVAIREAGRA
ncbi:MAG: aminotransferase class III-fold pyridoxal phosphate-dependent enzyme [Gemmatimonadaceae bacterium]|nr:aminotransferase class III-fold pyridoxal phosphate-dependent enzyme [Gemmatimonadaceae bacterium]NUQ93305.1 aminotransferase class III-fold pyridoxal phosphate-dependent enzyme [Gemmatimonadaceae bacterium]NUR18038.1 aminotransferase class III-fold pyridoxal phosphate-dependent enzyme [Gemmatimonadaceae bacterium]NUS97457.1 aminotransferase class III-fold pyridoxal phosphate-dependent enzyme [Gemmatimonadaceae bacterium]